MAVVVVGYWSRTSTTTRQRITRQGTHKQIRIALQRVRQAHGVNFEHTPGEEHVDQQALGVGLVRLQLPPRLGPFRGLRLRQDARRPNVPNRHAYRIGKARGRRKRHDKGADLRAVVGRGAQQVHAAKGADNACARQHAVNGTVAKGAVQRFGR